MSFAGLKRPHAVSDQAAPHAQKRSHAAATDLPVSPPSTPRAGETLIAIQLAKVRTGCEMTSPEAGQLQEGTKITVVDTATNESGVLRIKFEQEEIKGWVSVKTGSGEQILEPVHDEEVDAESSVLDDLIDMYKEKNGRDPTDDEVKQWVVTLKEAAEEKAEQAEQAEPTEPAVPVEPPVPGLVSGPVAAGDPLGLGQSHLAASDLGLPSFGVQATKLAAAKAAATGPPLAPMAELNTAFLSWMEAQLQKDGGCLDLSPGLRDYQCHARNLISGANTPAPDPVKLPAWHARHSSGKSRPPATPATPATPCSPTFTDEVEERALASKSQAQQAVIKYKFKALMQFMQKGVEVLREEHGDNYEVTAADIEAIKRAFASTA